MFLARPNLAAPRSEHLASTDVVEMTEQDSSNTGSGFLITTV